MSKSYIPYTDVLYRLEKGEKLRLYCKPNGEMQYAWIEGFNVRKPVVDRLFGQNKLKQVDFIGHNFYYQYNEGE